MKTVTLTYFLLTFLIFSSTFVQGEERDWEAYHEALSQAIEEMDARELPRRIMRDPDPQKVKMFFQEEMTDIHARWLELGNWREAYQVGALAEGDLQDISEKLSTLKKRIKTLYLSIPSKYAIRGGILADEFVISERMWRDLSKDNLRMKLLQQRSK